MGTCAGLQSLQRDWRQGFLPRFPCPGYLLQQGPLWLSGLVGETWVLLSGPPSHLSWDDLDRVLQHSASWGLAAGLARAGEALGDCLEGLAAGHAEVPPRSAASAPQYDQQSISKACGKDAQTRLAHCRCTMEVRWLEGSPH